MNKQACNECGNLAWYMSADTRECSNCKAQYDLVDPYSESSRATPEAGQPDIIDQMRETAKEAESWPNWQRQAAGLEPLPQQPVDCASVNARLNGKTVLEMLEMHIVDYPTPENIAMQRKYLAALKASAPKRESGLADLLAAAKAVIAKAHENLEKKPRPHRWVCPWEEFNALNAAINQIEDGGSNA